MIFSPVVFVKKVVNDNLQWFLNDREIGLYICSKNNTVWMREGKMHFIWESNYECQL